MPVEPSPRATISLVVPCYNEGTRFRPGAFLAALNAHPCLQLLLVDDGSTDNTRQILDGVARDSQGRALVLALARNAGKAEAVRQGLLQAVAGPCEFAGYWDADLATPFDALSDFLEVFTRRPGTEIVIGSRVRLLGRQIHRSTVRHYVGRGFATGASQVLGLPVYDTQCGAKLFRNTARLRRMIDRPFRSRWIFDVELLARFLDDTDQPAGAAAADGIYELALRTWVDEPGSKVKPIDGLSAFADLFHIYRQRARP